MTTLTRKRTVVKDRRKFFRFILVSSLLLNFIFFGIISPRITNADIVLEPIEVTVRCGDNLWSIAEAYCPEDEDIRNFVYRIKKENSLSVSTLSVGQKLLVPQE